MNWNGSGVVNVSRANAAQVSSNLRLSIAAAVAESGIVVDYPHRDIQLHAASPLQVQVVAGTGDGRFLTTLASDRAQAQP